MRTLDDHDSWFEPITEVFLFCSRAADLYSAGGDAIKQKIVQTVGSNATLKDQKLSIEAKKPLFRCGSTRSIYKLRAVVDEVRTAWYSHDPIIMEMLDCIQEIKRKLPPGALLSPASVQGENT